MRIRRNMVKENFTLRLAPENRAFVEKFAKNHDEVLSLGAAINEIIKRYRTRGETDICEQVRKVLTTDKELLSMTEFFIRQQVEKCLEARGLSQQKDNP